MRDPRITPLNPYPLTDSLDDALYLAMIDAVGETLAFRAVDATLRVLREWPMPNPPPYPADDENDDA